MPYPMAAVRGRVVRQSEEAAVYTAQGVNFDGTTILQRGADLTGAVDSKVGSCSFWLRPGSDDQNSRFFDGTSGGNVNYHFGLGINEQLAVILRNPAGTFVNNFRSSNGVVTAAAGWQHFLISWNQATVTRHLYRSDVSDLVNINAPVDDVVDYTGGQVGLGGRGDGLDNLLNGDLADFWCDFATYIDFSVEANRRKFVSAGLKPVDLGADGSIPTGTAPIMFFSGPTVDWHTNKGTGGGFTETGALTDSSSSPSD